MPRLNPINPATATGRTKEIFDGPLAGKHFNLFKGLANSAAALDMYLGMAGALEKASLTFKEREAIQLAIAAANNCAYCESAHTALGKKAGLSEQQTIEARRGSLLDAKLDALVKFALSVHEKRGFVSDQDVARFKAAGYSDAALTEVIAVYALATYTNMFNHVNGTVTDFPAAPQI